MSSNLPTIAASFFLAMSFVTGILTFILFSGLFGPRFQVDPYAELLGVILSLALLLGGFADLYYNVLPAGSPVDLSLDTVLGVSLLIAASFVSFLDYAIFYLKIGRNFSIEGHTFTVAASDKPWGLGLAVVLIILAIATFYIRKP